MMNISLRGHAISSKPLWVTLLVRERLLLITYQRPGLVLRIVEQAAGHLRWKVDYPPSQPVGSEFEPHWRPQPAKLPSFGGYSLETLLYHDFPMAHKITVNQTGAFYFSQARSEDVFNFFQKQTNDSYRFIWELMDVFGWLVFTSNLISQTTWLKVKLKLVNL